MNEESNEKPEEKRASLFAACIMMPKKDFVEAFNFFIKCENNIIQELASKFGVSITAVKRRMEELEIDHC